MKEMQDASSIRNKLIALHEKLSPLDQALLQIAAVIYEPTDAATIFKILKEAKLTFPDVDITGVELVKARLSRLQDLKFLGGKNQCHQAFIEIACRKALAIPVISTQGEKITNLELPSAWSRPKAGAVCFSCRKPLSDLALENSFGFTCLSCVDSELEALAAKEDLANWSISRLKKALSSEGDLFSRLTVLWRFNEAVAIVAARIPSEVEALLALAVRNIGHADGHPMEQTVRQAALNACHKQGQNVLPHIFNQLTKEPWQFYINAIMLAAALSSHDEKVVKLLEEASRDSNAEVRKRALLFVTSKKSSWSGRLANLLLTEPDPALANKSYATLKRYAENRRKHSDEAQSHSPSNRFELIARCVQENLPARWSYYDKSEESCRRVMRELRIALYTQDMELLRQSYDHIVRRCPDSYSKPEPLARICTNPFDPIWFKSLSVSLQREALVEIFYNAAFTLSADAEPLSYALDGAFLDTLSEAQKPSFYHHLVSRLILGGRLVEARKLIEEMEKQSEILFGMRGWVYLLEGKEDEALASFAKDLKALQARMKKRSFYFGGFEGFVYILALLLREDPGLYATMQSLIDSATMSSNGNSFMLTEYKSLRAVAFSQRAEVDAARKITSKLPKNAGGLRTFIHALIVFWSQGEIDEERTDALSEVFVRAREIGLDWIAVESAELLCRTEGETPVRRNYIERMCKETGITPIVSRIRIEEMWKRRLRALVQTTAPPVQQIESPQEVSSRLVWLVSLENDSLALNPVEQKRSAKGSWTKGRPVALSRLFGEPRPDYLTPRDHAICSAIEREGRYSYVTHRIDMAKALPDVIGHPLLFLAEAPEVRVEVARGEPEVLVTQEGQDLVIRFSPEKTDSRLVVIRETPTRFKVVELTEEHRNIARILGAEGLSVPASASKDVLEAIAGISSHVTVHSAIGGSASEIIEAEADSTPHAHLAPSGSGFRLELFTQPLGPGGPYLKPGRGMENIISEVDGRLLHTRRDLKREEQRAEIVETVCASLATLGSIERSWLLNDPQECLEVLFDLRAMQERGEVVVEWPEGEKLKLTREASFNQLRLTVREKTDWFEITGDLQVEEGRVVDMKRLLEAMQASKSRFIPLEEGEFLVLTRELQRRLEELELYAQKHGKDLRLHPLAALAVQDFMDRLPHLDADESWKRRIEGIRAGLSLIPQIPSTFKAVLRDYQIEGFQWLARLAHLGLGACLADDMGLGKTIQALAILLKRAPDGPSLVVAPTSVCMNWVSEANRFAPTINVNLLANGNREDLIRGLGPMDLLVTSYGLMAQETELLSSVEWSCIVLDEAQAIKNIATKRTQAAMSLKGGFKMITTGTPVENHLSELWTLYNFINNGLLGSRQKFNERFAIPIERYNDRDARTRLKKLIQPFILRRTKAQVLEELPPRTEVSLQVELSEEEKAFYEALRRQALERLSLDDAPAAQKHIKILAEIIRLRQACCHPRMVAPESPLSSAKIALFGEIVSELMENGHKALVFSQFVSFLGLIREYLDSRGIDYRYLDGSTPPAERKRQVDLFQAGHGDLFLISLKAGGLGLNLTAADYVIHMDPWWNPAVEDQASDRAHRIGQLHPVTVYRLVTQNTIEEKIIKLHQEKRDLAGSLLDGSDISGKISAEELLNLISGRE